MSEILVLERFDNSSWGFRLTGGLDFGTPLTVLKVIGGSIAELSGVKVGDLIVEINGKPAKSLTHVDAQNCIIESGDRLTLSIMRGSEVTPPATTPLRGMTPLHGVEDYLLNNLSDSHSFSHDQLNEKLDSIKTTEMNTTSLESGIDYCTESTREVLSDDVSFLMEQHEKTYSEQAIDDVSDLEIAELLTGNEEVLDEGILGINFKKYHPKVDFIRESEVFKLLQKENVRKEVPEEVQLQKDPTKRFSTFLMKPKQPPSPKPIGPYWHYPKPPKYLAKEAEPPKEEPKRRKVVSDKGHTVLWLFLDPDGEEVVDERWGTPAEERINLSRNDDREDDQMSTTSSMTDSEHRRPKLKIQAQALSLDPEAQSGRQSPKFEATTFVENAAEAKKQAFKRGSKTFAKTVDYETSEDAVEQARRNSETKENWNEVVMESSTEGDEEGTNGKAERKQRRTEKTTRAEENGLTYEESRTTEEETETVKKEIKSSERVTKKVTEESSKMKEKTVVREEFSGGIDGLAKVKDKTEDFEKKLAQIQEQLELLKGQATGDLQSQLVEIKEQLSKMVQIQTSSKYLTSEVNNVDETQEEYNSVTEEKTYESESRKESSEEEYEYERETTKLEEKETIETQKEYHENGVEEYETEEHKTIIEEYERGEFELCEVPAPVEEENERERQEKKKKAQKQLLTPLPRPIVLPGGRMWRRPKDAAYDEFYQGVLVEQAEVLVGSEGAVNFRKYIPPRFDAQNSAVARFVHELEQKTLGRERVVPEDKYYQTPISKRHFYAASLPQPEPVGVVELEEMYSDV